MFGPSLVAVALRPALCVQQWTGRNEWNQYGSSQMKPATFMKEGFNACDE
jgi:hypothetical protein